MMSLCAYILETRKATRPNCRKLLRGDLAISIFVQQLEYSLCDEISLLLMFNLILL